MKAMPKDDRMVWIAVHIPRWALAQIRRRIDAGRKEGKTAGTAAVGGELLVKGIGTIYG